MQSILALSAQYNVQMEGTADVSQIAPTHDSKDNSFQAAFINRKNAYEQQSDTREVRPDRNSGEKAEEIGYDSRDSRPKDVKSDSTDTVSEGAQDDVQAAQDDEPSPDTEPQDILSLLPAFFILPQNNNVTEDQGALSMETQEVTQIDPQAAMDVQSTGETQITDEATGILEGNGTQGEAAPVDTKQAADTLPQNGLEAMPEQAHSTSEPQARTPQVKEQPTQSQQIQPEEINQAERQTSSLENAAVDMADDVQPAQNTSNTEPAEPVQASDLPVAATQQDAQAQSDTGDASGANSDANAQLSKTQLPKINPESGMQVYQAVSGAAEATAATSAQSARSQAIFDQMIEKMSQSIKAGSQRFDIQLRPESLGKLDIRLVMNKDGLTAKIITADSEVQGLISSQVEQLQQSLKEAGVQVHKMDIVYSGFEQNTQKHSNSNEQSGGSKHRRVRTEMSEKEMLNMLLTQYAPILDAGMGISAAGSSSVEFSA